MFTEYHHFLLHDGRFVVVGAWLPADPTPRPMDPLLQMAIELDPDYEANPITVTVPPQRWVYRIMVLDKSDGRYHAVQSRPGAPPGRPRRAEGHMGARRSKLSGQVGVWEEGLMIAIINLTPENPSPATYSVGINENVVTTFEHHRGDGLSECLRRAAVAVEKQRLRDLLAHDDDLYDR